MYYVLTIVLKTRQLALPDLWSQIPLSKSSTIVNAFTRFWIAFNNKKEIVDMPDQNTHEQNLAQLKRDGFLLIRQALAQDAVREWKAVLYDLYSQGEYEIKNGVGNVAFEKLLLLQPEQPKALMSHPNTCTLSQGHSWASSASCAAFAPM